MLKASSLLYVIFILLIVSSITSSFILFAYYQKLNIARYEGRIKAMDRVNSGINFLKAKPFSATYNKQVSLFNDEESQVLLKANHWGAFYFISAQANFETDTFNQSALCGLKKQQTFAVWLADNNKPLSLVGGTRITGTSFIPKRGLKRAYIEGQSYTGTKMIDGEQKQSDTELPPINNTLKEYLVKSLKKGVSEVALDVINYTYEEFEHRLFDKRSFSDSTLCYYSALPIEIDKGEIEGNIILKSEHSIYLSNAVKAKNILLVAPRVEIESNFEGSIHIVASDTILIGDMAQLKYPSSVLVNSTQNKSYIKLGADCNVEGEIILNGMLDDKHHGLIEVKDNATLTGNVYSFDRLILKGEVNGSLSCNTFLLKTNTSIYENHILNGKVNSNKLPKNYFGTNWSQIQTQPKTIIEWLN